MNAIPAEITAPSPRLFSVTLAAQPSDMSNVRDLSMISMRVPDTQAPF